MLGELYWHFFEALEGFFLHALSLPEKVSNIPTELLQLDHSNILLVWVIVNVNNVFSSINRQSFAKFERTKKCFIFLKKLDTARVNMQVLQTF